MAEGGAMRCNANSYFSIKHIYNPRNHSVMKKKVHIHQDVPRPQDMMLAGLGILVIIALVLVVFWLTRA